jgi:hypothetical protein
MATKTSTTVNRGWLKRQAEAGKLVMLESYHYDETHGEDRTHKELPVRVSQGAGDWLPGFCTLYPHDFKSKSGAAWRNPDGTITLHVHSNCHYTFKAVDS